MDVGAMTLGSGYSVCSSVSRGVQWWLHISAMCAVRGVVLGGSSTLFPGGSGDD